jgi:hypothetical protein
MAYKKLYNSFLSIIIFFTAFFTLSGQNTVFSTFKDTRVINTHSVEILPARQLDVRIGHRFGDMFGDRGGWPSFYGLENASDVLIGIEYGVSDEVTIGINRTKGAGPLRQLINGLFKVKLKTQTSDGRTPFSIAFVATGTVSTMQKSTDPESINFFSSFDHRIVYSGQLLLARKFSSRFSLQLGGGLLHRNIVPHNDENNLYFLNGAARIQLSKVFGLIIDATFPISDLRTADRDYYLPIGVGFEIETGGHVFQVNFTNATGLAEADYIPHTRTDWSEGEFRLGFTISRRFNL